jgi:hypothetical protein
MNSGRIPSAAGVAATVSKAALIEVVFDMRLFCYLFSGDEPIPILVGFTEGAEAQASGLPGWHNNGLKPVLPGCRKKEAFGPTAKST